MNPEETFKKRRNEAFKKGDYPAALSDYYHALLHLRTVGGLQPANDLKERPNEQLVKIYNNQCAVLAKQEKWPRVLDTAIQAREIDAENFKVVNAAAMTKSTNSTISNTIVYPVHPCPTAIRRSKIWFMFLK
ncbi:hypothetical protein BDB00DRAFT_856199 [Zychaea mexicana]|uniref:uncharacterized protein n=1 Tax=Zychaea mexicana TaxID=64656 RepID=UPI0022FE2070|nr:uncharacterized protein BDB00DRAFT_856199 [Zychaea mexicana]KAI9484371.1 hypothetical protein BDB00DRAFT_856199 [Zychaea mexicana]